MRMRSSTSTDGSSRSGVEGTEVMIQKGRGRSGYKVMKRERRRVSDGRW